MAQKFALTPGQKKAFEELLSNKVVSSAAQLPAKGSFDETSALGGFGKAFNEIKLKLPADFSTSALLVCDPDNSKDVLLGLAKFISGAGYAPVLVLFASNYKTVSKLIGESGFIGKYFIIDCVSKGISSIDETESVLFVDSMRNLTQLQIKILNLMDKNKKTAFVFDSLFTLSLYHEEGIALKFVYSVLKLLRRKSSPAYAISAEVRSSKKFAQFFDETVELKKFY